MAFSLSSAPALSSSSHAAFLMPRLSLLRRLSVPRHGRRLFAVAQQQQEQEQWSVAKLARICPAAESIFHLTMDISDAPSLGTSYTMPGQYLQARAASEPSPSVFLSIASPPALAAKEGVLEFLVKSVEGSAAGVLCAMREGEEVELSPVMGRGFNIPEIEPTPEFPSVFIFATGTGISPIRSLIESGFDADKRPDVRLYYGARNLQRMAYQDRFKHWESSGIKIIPVLSRPDDSWKGERGYVQAAFARAKQISDPFETGAVLCGHKQMTEDVISLLVRGGVSREKILKSF
ncbi:hypothetical protein AMTRI_Chr13g119520 [Amborella trichopoda]|uniref:fruit protein pKIWI502 n=1 Tax=Amborella trichopoda TaxID=13333 RepID=UPI0005D33BA6|nr:fruit protein pKIWI502 [Amborella trichopoda]|eukprot:XP_011623192.1 fruit protein pKIWI502 [Amborella trichopoda]